MRGLILAALIGGATGCGETDEGVADSASSSANPVFERSSAASILEKFLCSLADRDAQVAVDCIAPSSRRRFVLELLDGYELGLRLGGMFQSPKYEEYADTYAEILARHEVDQLRNGGVLDSPRYVALVAEILALVGEHADTVTIDAEDLTQFFVDGERAYAEWKDERFVFVHAEGGWLIGGW